MTVPAQRPAPSSPYTPPTPGDVLLTPGEVADLFRVDPKTVTRWAKSGRIASIRTPGGHRRFWQSVVSELLNGDDATI